MSGTSQRAAVMLSLATVYTYYSSSHHFGTEQESPQLLRNYARALLTEAHRLDPQIVSNEKLSDWQNRLIPGQTRPFSCTAVLTGIMKRHIDANKQKNPALEVFDTIFPIAWR